MGFAEIHRKGSHGKMEHPDGRRIVFFILSRGTDIPFVERTETLQFLKTNS